MPVLHLNEEEVAQVLTMEMAVDAVEAGFRKMGIEEAFLVPRMRCQTDLVMLHVLPAAAKTLGVIGFKAYTATKGRTSFHVTLYDSRTGEMLAILQADGLGQMRTGAASAVATKWLSRPESATVGVFGTGKQARTQILGVCSVRTITRISVYGRDPERCATFSRRLADEMGKEVIPVSVPQEAAQGHDIVITATTAREPVLKGEWISPGQHLNIVGSNFLTKSEIDVEVIRRANRLYIDSKEQGKLEAGDLIAALDQGVIEWGDVTELGRVVSRARMADKARSR